MHIWQKIKCFFGFHTKVYWSKYPNCRLDRWDCEYCDRSKIQ